MKKEITPQGRVSVHPHETIVEKLNRIGLNGCCKYIAQQQNILDDSLATIAYKNGTDFDTLADIVDSYKGYL